MNASHCSVEYCFHWLWYRYGYLRSISQSSQPVEHHKPVVLIFPGKHLPTYFNNAEYPTQPNPNPDREQFTQPQSHSQSQSSQSPSPPHKPDTRRQPAPATVAPWLPSGRRCGKSMQMQMQTGIPRRGRACTLTDRVFGRRLLRRRRRRRSLRVRAIGGRHGRRRS
jgi:hypothetical protein